MKYNIPRVSIDRTDELTEYEYDYDMLCHYEFNARLEYADQFDPFEAGTTTDKGMRTDPLLYQELKQQLEEGGDLDYLLPEDYGSGPTLSSILHEKELGEEPVDPDEVFGGGSSG